MKGSAANRDMINNKYCSCLHGHKELQVRGCNSDCALARNGTVLFVISFPSAPSASPVGANPTEWEQLCVNTLRQKLPWIRDSSDFTSGKADSHCFWCAGCTFSQSSSTHSWGGFIYTTQYPQDTHYFIHLTSASIGGISAHSKEEEIFDAINTLFTFKLNVGFHSSEK